MRPLPHCNSKPNILFNLMDNEAPQILLLCENEKSAQLERRILRDAGFTQLRVLTSGIEAARLLAGLTEDPRPALTICHHKLGDMDGEQFCAIIRQHPLLLGYPALLIMPNDSEAEQLKTLGCGASALLGRPYSPETLKEKITALLKAKPAQNMLKNAAMQVDTSAFDTALATYGVLLRPSRDPEDYFRAGMRCLEEHRWNLAISAFEHALRHAQVKAEAELGMAAAYKGKGDMEHCKQWLSRAAQTFVTARCWHHARAAYAKLLRHDPRAKNPFITEAHKLIHQRKYNEAAAVLAQGAEVTPRENAGDRYARLCFAAEDPQAMLEALETGLAKNAKASFDFLGGEIRQSLDALVREREARDRELAAERKWQLSRAMAEQQQKAQPQKSGRIELAEEKKAVMFGEDEPLEDEPPDYDLPEDEPLDYPDAEKNAAAPVLAPLSQNEATTSMFEGKPKLNELLSVMKLTWKLAKRSKNKP